MRPSIRQLLITAGPLLALLVIGLAFRILSTAQRTPRLALGLSIAVAVFVVLLGSYVFAYVRNVQVFATRSTFGRRDFLGRVQTWPLGELAEVRFQRISWGGGSIPRRAFLFISLEHRLLIRIEPNFWREEDLRGLAAKIGVPMKEGATQKLAAFTQEFPDATPRWVPRTRTQFALLTLVLIGSILLVTVVIAFIGRAF